MLVSYTRDRFEHSNPVIEKNNFFVTEFAEFSENISEKLECARWSSVFVWGSRTNKGRGPVLNAAIFFPK